MCADVKGQWCPYHPGTVTCERTTPSAARRAVASPIPLLPPVIRAVLACSLIAISSALRCRPDRGAQSHARPPIQGDVQSGLGIGRRRGHRRRGRAARCGGRRCGRGGGSVPVSGPGGPAFGGPWGGSGPRLRDSGGGFWGWICGAREDGGGLRLLVRRPRRCGRPRSPAPPTTAPPVEQKSRPAHPRRHRALKTHRHRHMRAVVIE
jgi:hypothetical protein